MGWEDYVDWGSDEDRAKRKALKDKASRDPSIKLTYCKECGDVLLKGEVGYCQPCINYAHSNN